MLSLRCHGIKKAIHSPFGERVNRVICGFLKKSFIGISRTASPDAGDLAERAAATTRQATTMHQNTRFLSIATSIDFFTFIIRRMALGSYLCAASINNAEHPVANSCLTRDGILVRAILAFSSMICGSGCQAFFRKSKNIVDRSVSSNVQ
jgi:hypothetical protein